MASVAVRKKTDEVETLDKTIPNKPSRTQVNRSWWQLSMHSIWNHKLETDETSKRPVKKRKVTRNCFNSKIKEVCVPGTKWLTSANYTACVIYEPRTCTGLFIIITRLSRWTQEQAWNDEKYNLKPKWKSQSLAELFIYLFIFAGNGIKPHIKYYRNQIPRRQQGDGPRVASYMLRNGFPACIRWIRFQM